MDKNKVTVFVAGHKLTLLTNETEKYVTDIASRVDTAINTMFSTTNMSKEKCAVMAALDFCDDEHKARTSLNEVKEQIKDYIDDSTKLRAENEALKAEVARLKGEKEELLKSKKTMIASSVDIKAPKEDENKEKEISAEDDLFFDEEETEKEAEVKVEAPTVDTKKPQPAPAPKADKKRHNHEHVNPYKERFMQKKAEDKGYTPVRQYSFFDDNKDE